MPLSVSAIRDALASHARTYRFYDKITKMSRIARRYFVLNAFDGALTIFGVVLGAYLAGVTHPEIVIAVGLSTSVAIGISGLWGAFLTESAERRKEIKELEKLMMVKLEKTEITSAARWAISLTALIDALAPVAAALIILAPFYVAEPGLIDIHEAYLAALWLSFAVFFLLGVFLGRISRENIVVDGAKMLLAGISAALLTWFLSGGRL